MAKADLIKRKYPDIDADLYCAAVAVHDELAILFKKEEPLNNAEVIRMKELINLLLLVKKSSKSRRKQTDDAPTQTAANSEELFK